MLRDISISVRLWDTDSENCGGEGVLPIRIGQREKKKEDNSRAESASVLSPLITKYENLKRAVWLKVHQHRVRRCGYAQHLQHHKQKSFRRRKALY